MCKFKYLIISEKGLVHSIIHLDLIVLAYSYYLFVTNMHNCILNPWKDKWINYDNELRRHEGGDMIKRNNIKPSI